MTPNNQKLFRRLLKVLGILCVFLLGSVIGVPVSARFFVILASVTIGLTVGYCLGSGRDLRFWKGLKLVKKDDDEKK